MSVHTYVYICASMLNGRSHVFFTVPTGDGFSAHALCPAPSPACSRVGGPQPLFQGIFLQLIFPRLCLSRDQLGSTVAFRSISTLSSPTCDFTWVLPFLHLRNSNPVTWLSWVLAHASSCLKRRKVSINFVKLFVPCRVLNLSLAQHRSQLRWCIFWIFFWL